MAIPTKQLVLFARRGAFGRRKQAASGSASRTSATAAPTGGVLLRPVGIGEIGVRSFRKPAATKWRKAKLVAKPGCSNNALDGGAQIVKSATWSLACKHESVWTPGKNVGGSIEFSSTCRLVKHGGEWLLWDAGVPEAAHNDPKGWSTLPKLIVDHLDKTLTDQLAEIGLEPVDITHIAISRTHGDHIGNVSLFANATILMQRAEYRWINSSNGPNDNINQLMGLAVSFSAALEIFS